MNTPATILPVLLAATLLSGCGASRRADSGAPRGDANLITAEELSATTSSTLYDAVNRLRPAWLMRVQRPTALDPRQRGDLIVYMDGIRFGNLESLRQLTTRGIASVRFHSAGSAEAKFGPGHLLGAIEILTIPQ